MKKTLTLLAACVLLSGCELFLAHHRIEFNEAAFNRARSAWEAQGITSYTFETSGFSAGPWPVFRITVVDGEFTSLEPIDAGTWQNLDVFEDMIMERRTIPMVFDQIAARYRRARANPPRVGYRYSIGVAYNAEYHFPESVSTTGVVSTRRPVDGGWGNFTIKNFRPVR